MGGSGHSHSRILSGQAQVIGDRWAVDSHARDGQAPRGRQQAPEMSRGADNNSVIVRPGHDIPENEISSGAAAA